MGAEDMERHGPTSSGCTCSARRRGPSSSARRRSGGDERGDPRLDRQRTTHYMIGSCVGPHPYPARPRPPGRDRARGVDGSSKPKDVCPTLRLRAWAAARMRSGSSAASSTTPRCGSSASRPMTRRASATAAPGCCTGALVAPRGRGRPDPRRTLVAAGLDYPGVGPEHAFLRDSGRADYVDATDAEARAAFERLARTEGIIPALEPAHARAGRRPPPS